MIDLHSAMELLLRWERNAHCSLAPQCKMPQPSLQQTSHAASQVLLPSERQLYILYMLHK